MALPSTALDDTAGYDRVTLVQRPGRTARPRIGALVFAVTVALTFLGGCNDEDREEPTVADIGAEGVTVDLQPAAR